jgi:hypothetical protein
MLADVLHKVAAMEAEEEEAHAYYPRPSIAGLERCSRQMVYWARGEVKKPIPGRSIVVMNDSSWHEELTADLIRKSAFQLHSQQMPVTLPGVLTWREDLTYYCSICKETVNRRDLHGHSDFLVTDVLGHDWLVEHKAISHFSWEGLVNGEMPLDYLTQLAIYMRGLQIFNPTLTRGLLLCKNKNTSGYLEFYCTYHNEQDVLTVHESKTHTGDVRPLGRLLPGIVQDAIERFRLVNDYVEQQKLPLRQYQHDHWRCEYCSYQDTCWSGYVAEHALYKDDVALGGWAYALLEKYRSLTDEETTLGKTKDGLKEEIKSMLTRLGVKHGIAGDIAVKFDAYEERKLNPDLLPIVAREAAMVPVLKNKLSVRRMGGKGKTKTGDKT